MVHTFAIVRRAGRVITQTVSQMWTNVKTVRVNTMVHALTTKDHTPAHVWKDGRVKTVKKIMTSAETRLVRTEEHA